MWNELGQNPDLHSDRLAADCLSHGATSNIVFQNTKADKFKRATQKFKTLFQLKCLRQCHKR